MPACTGWEWIHWNIFPQESADRLNSNPFSTAISRDFKNYFWHWGWIRSGLGFLHQFRFSRTISSKKCIEWKLFSELVLCSIDYIKKHVNYNIIILLDQCQVMKLHYLTMPNIIDFNVNIFLIYAQIAPSPILVTEQLINLC